ncbi:hypothetical protein [Thermodesulforhabdus norvegica]|uniref:Uncharacterized protein n=1 Tax=Thermodesulforhabdus norvegica TaxID=39841 RepID=A0A1I4WFU0_9BACT|nr:hypothetical protein [Thermodesulforhabdus norvegica]SFN11869.1 hypothetical protein SAMN05660836_02712 [Thermodesulforhabdus norvegica]
MKDSKELNRIIEKLIDFDNISVGFKVEFKDGESKKTYVLTENENGYLIEIKKGNRPIRINLNSSENLHNQNELSSEDKEVFSKLFDRLNSNQVDKISIGGLRLRNPILTASIGQSIIANVSKQISPEDRIELYNLWKENEEKFEEKFQDIVIDIIISQLKDKLESDDLPTPIFPTSVASSEIPNYYIYEPKETYTLDTKIELFNKLADSICGRCGQRLYGLYVPEEGIEIKEILKSYVPDFYNVNIGSIAGVGRINLREVGPFEYMFYLLDKVLQEMFRGNKIPLYHVELFMIEGVGGGKKFYLHYVIPNLNEVYSKLYRGNDRYTSYGISKIKSLISSFLVENWNIDNNLKKNNSETAHAHINRLLYFIFYHRKLDMDSILFLEDLKIKLGDTTPIKYLEEVISWM